ncbi:hypothetical protein WMY93_020534 [Mugilogobius chulae]|uniref:MADF domain-containing protein n=1 Tax=Mugilogobius chulae TaxID=88201 RepID=A0AAW0NJA1_9GOBI
MGVDDDLITAVFAKPVLYNVTLKDYRDRLKKDIAWRRTSEEVGLSVDICKKRWKSLRDTYMKERRKAKEKRSGSAAGSAKKWRFFEVLTFLDRFISPRETSGNMTRVEEMQASDDRPEEQEEAAAGLSEVGDTNDEDSLRQSPHSDLPAAAAASLLLLLIQSRLALLLHPQIHRGREPGSGPRTEPWTLSRSCSWLYKKNLLLVLRQRMSISSCLCFLSCRRSRRNLKIL